MLGKTCGSSVLCRLCPGTEQRQGSGVSWASEAPLRPPSKAPSAHLNAPWEHGGCAPLRGNPEAEQSNKPGGQDDCKSQGLSAPEKAAGEHCGQTERKADSSAKGSPLAMEATLAERPTRPQGSPRTSRAQSTKADAPPWPPPVRNIGLLFWLLFPQTRLLFSLPSLAQSVALYRLLTHSESVSSCVKAGVSMRAKAGLLHKIEHIWAARCHRFL